MVKSFMQSYDIYKYIATIVYRDAAVGVRSKYKMDILHNIVADNTDFIHRQS